MDMFYPAEQQSNFFFKEITSFRVGAKLWAEIRVRFLAGGRVRVSTKSFFFGGGGVPKKSFWVGAWRWVEIRFIVLAGARVRVS